MSPLDRDGAHPAPGAIGCRHQGSHQSKDEGKEGQDQGSAAGLAVRPAWETGWWCGAALSAERGHGRVGEGILPCSQPMKPMDMLFDVERKRSGFPLENAEKKDESARSVRAGPAQCQ